jgi:hypothetical protein
MKFHASLLEWISLLSTEWFRQRRIIPRIGIVQCRGVHHSFLLMPTLMCCVWPAGVLVHLNGELTLESTLCRKLSNIFTLPHQCLNISSLKGVHHGEFVYVLPSTHQLGFDYPNLVLKGGNCAARAWYEVH